MRILIQNYMLLSRLSPGGSIAGLLFKNRVLLDLFSVSVVDVWLPDTVPRSHARAWAEGQM